MAFIFHKIFERLLPDCYRGLKRTGVSDQKGTSYLEFMIEKILCNSEADDLLSAIQRNLKRFVGVFTAVLEGRQLSELFLQNS